MGKMADLAALKKIFKAFATELIEDGNENKPSYLQHPQSYSRRRLGYSFVFYSNFGPTIPLPILKKQIRP